MFLQGHLDQESKTLYVTDQGYQTFYRRRIGGWNSRTEKRRTGQNREGNTGASTGSEKADCRWKMLILRRSGRSNEAISDETVSRKLYDLETVTRKIFDYVKTHPQCADDTKKMMKYYLQPRSSCWILMKN